MAPPARIGPSGIGRELSAPLITFGPNTVAMKAAENAVIVGDVSRALRTAQSVRTPARRSDNYHRHRLDVAASYLGLRDYVSAFDVLREVRHEAPDWLAHQRLARELTDSLVRHRPRPVTTEMREFAESLGLS